MGKQKYYFNFTYAYPLKNNCLFWFHIKVLCWFCTPVIAVRFRKPEPFMRCLYVC